MTENSQTFKNSCQAQITFNIDELCLDSFIDPIYDIPNTCTTQELHAQPNVENVQID